MRENLCVFICFAAKDRYTIAEPIVHHLKTMEYRKKVKRSG